MKKNFWKEYFSIPNIMGYFRIVLAAVYLWLFYRAVNGEAYWPVFAVIVVSGITDFLDGKVARRFDMVTDWGKMLDPIADKISIGVIIISLAMKYKLVIAMIILYVLKEGYMSVMGICLIKRGYKIEGAKWYGKFCTFVTYVILMILLVIPLFTSNISIVLVNVMIVANMLVMVFTLVEYVVYHKQLLSGK